MPWYYKAKRFHMILIGIASAIGLMLAIDPSRATFYSYVLFDEREWNGLRPYAVLGELFGYSFVGALVGWWAYTRLHPHSPGNLVISLS